MKKFSELEYVRPDFEALKGTITDLLQRYKKASSYEEARDIFLELQNASG